MALFNCVMEKYHQLRFDNLYIPVKVPFTLLTLKEGDVRGCDEDQATEPSK